MGAFSAETEAFLRQAMERHSAMVYRLAYARTRACEGLTDSHHGKFVRERRGQRMAQACNSGGIFAA